MADTALVKKLLIKPGNRVAVVNSPPGYLDRLSPLPERVELVDRPDGTFDVVHLFVWNREELPRLGPAVVGVAKQEGVLWISYPKQSSKVKTDITRDVGWETISSAGLRPVSAISIDDVWSALRFRPLDMVGKGS